MKVEEVILLMIPFKNKEAQRNAKSFGFKWNGQFWTKTMESAKLPYYLVNYRVFNNNMMDYTQQVLAGTYVE